MQSNILLIGEYFSKNQGDPLLCRTVEKIISEKYPETNIIPFDMSGKVNFEQNFQVKEYDFKSKMFFKVSEKIPRIMRKSPLYCMYKKDEMRYIRTVCSLKETIKSQNIQLAVFAGGSIFMDYFSGIIFLIVKLLEKEKIPVIFHACGLSHLSDDDVKVLHKAFHCKNVKSISLRDGYDVFSKRFCDVTVPIIKTYDTALGCSKIYEASKTKVAEYGIGVIGKKELYEFQKALIETFMKSETVWKIFLNGSDEDYQIACKLLDELGVPKEEKTKYLLKKPETPEELVHIVTSFEKIVSFRMHSQIVASSFGIPNFGFVWDDKVSALYKQLGAEENCMIPENEVHNLDFIKNMTLKKLKDTALKQGEDSKSVLLKSIKDVLDVGEE